MIEARVMDDQLASPLARGLDLYRGAEALGEFLFEAREIPIDALAARRRGATQQLLHQRFGLAHRESLRSDAARDFDLPRRLERDERACVAHFQRALHDKVLHL